jgi:hypothetical protein
METESLETTKDTERFQEEKPKKDRKLGDEWSDWSGDINEIEPAIAESKFKFLTFSLVAVLLLTGALGFFWYLVEPRILQLPAVLQTPTHAFMLILAILPVVLYGLLLMQVIFGVRVLSYRTIQSFLFFLLPKAVWLGRRFGQSRDKIGHSFVKVSNTVTEALGLPRSTPKLLVLLPRCLHVSVRKEVKSICESFPCHLATVGGGEEARKEIRKLRPDFIIAMACERDLITGIKDVSLHVPVIGIPNQRPEGPCKNTLIPIDEFKRALSRLFPHHPHQ